MDIERIAPHESFELHEILTFKTICATKSDVMSGLVKDEALKAMLHDDFRLGQDHIRELKSLLKLSAFYTGGDGGIKNEAGTSPVKH